MKKLIIGLVVLALSGCSTVSQIVPVIPKDQRPGPCANSDSFLYDTVRNPNLTEAVLKYASVKAITSIKDKKKRAEVVKIACKVIDKTAALLDTSNLMYSDFISAILTNFTWINQYAGTEVALLGPLVIGLGSKAVPISECDKYLLKTQLKNLKIEMLKYK